MSRSFCSKAGLLVVIVSLCSVVPIVNAKELASLEWTSPTTRDLQSVFMVSADDGWAVGNAGTIIRWNGTAWNTVTSPPVTFALTSVYMVSANDGWAVENFGAVIRWNGTAWNNFTSPTGEQLDSVFMVSANDGWAVGKRGTIIRWNGTAWNTVTSPTTAFLTSVYMVSADDGWAVGNAGTIVRWTGTEWVPEFPTAILVPLLLSVALVAVILSRTTSKKHTERSSPNNAQL